MNVSRALRKWVPFGAYHRHGQPKVGELLGHEHGVWQVTEVVKLPLSDADRDRWLESGMPDLGTWWRRPYEVHVVQVGGVRPGWAAEGAVKGTMTPNLERHAGWYVYPGGRWAQCSCCGEPMPCRAELEDREVTSALNRIDKLARRRPGCCWCCEEEVSSRQKAVVYDGDNLDLPGGPQVRFHTRRSCWHQATRYEERWLAVDPRRERILTWPKCGGLLLVHADGSSECLSAPGPLGRECSSAPDCQGHLTHDHGTQSACYVSAAGMALAPDMPGCTRGCDPNSRHGTWTTPRPPRAAAGQMELRTGGQP